MIKPTLGTCEICQTTEIFVTRFQGAYRCQPCADKCELLVELRFHVASALIPDFEAYMKAHGNRWLESHVFADGQTRLVTATGKYEDGKS